MSGPLLLGLSPLCLGIALLLWRLALQKRGDERVLQRLGQAYLTLRGSVLKRSRLDALWATAGMAQRPSLWSLLLAWLGGSTVVALAFGWFAGLLLLISVPLVGRGYMSWRSSRRTRRMIQQLPGLLDHCVRSLKAGRTLGDAILGAIDTTQEPLRSAMNRVRRNVQLGIPIEAAVSEMAQLYGYNEMRLFALGVRINQRHGGNASELMENLIKMIREQEQGYRQLRAMTGETRITAWILGGLPLAMVSYFLVTNPHYLMAMWRDSDGQMMLLFAFALQALGCVVLWRMLRRL